MQMPNQQMDQKLDNDVMAVPDVGYDGTEVMVVVVLHKHNMNMCHEKMVLYTDSCLVCNHAYHKVC
jgi:hypothetical protein